MSRFSHTLLQWYDQNARSLPWRDTHDPYRIWVSEVILQQTRVNQGYDYYLRFIERFPTVEDLAVASQDEVMRQWEGLGYYSRARNLHTAAQQIVDQGNFPNTYAGVRALKGVGDYTAAAICSFAFGLPTAAVDGNVYRVLSRYYGISTPIDSTAGKKEFATLAQSLIDCKRPADYNQALMDFGALQCTPKSPNCSSCPFETSCQAHASQLVDCLPVKSKKVAVSHRYLTYFFIFKDENLYIRQRPVGDIWAGLYEPLLIETPQLPSTEEMLSHPSIASLIGEQSTLRLIAQDLRHQLTHRSLHVTAFSLTQPTRLPKGLHPMPLEQREQYAFPRIILRLLEQFTSA